MKVSVLDPELCPSCGSAIMRRASNHEAIHMDTKKAQECASSSSAVPVARTVREKTRLWHDTIRRREVYVAIHRESPRRWNVIVDTMTLPPGLRLTDRICEAINGLIDVLYDNKETGGTSTLSGSEGCSTVLGPVKTQERAQEIARAVSAAIKDDHALLCDLRDSLGASRH